MPYFISTQHAQYCRLTYLCVSKPLICLYNHLITGNCWFLLSVNCGRHCNSISVFILFNPQRICDRYTLMGQEIEFQKKKHLAYYFHMKIHVSSVKSCLISLSCIFIHSHSLLCLSDFPVFMCVHHCHHVSFGLRNFTGAGYKK